jgi:toxin ParE1/3/4
MDEIAEYISKDSFQYAKEHGRQFFIKVKLLEKNPLMGRMVPEVKIFAIRQILCGHYRILYEIICRQQIGIIIVHHQSRLLKNNPAMKKLLVGKKKK